MPPDLLQPASDALDSLRSLPWVAHGVAIMALVSGFTLWLHGRRLLKPMIVVVLMLIGAVAGFVILPLTPFADSLSVNLGLIIGAVIGAVLGLLLYRFAMAISLGLVLGVIAPVLAVALINPPLETSAAEPLTKDELLLRGVPASSPNTSLASDLARRRDQLRESLQAAAERATELSTAVPDVAQAASDSTNAPESASDALVRTAAQRVRAFSEAVGHELSAQWNQLPGRIRVMLMGSAALGLGLGIILGLLMPAWTSGAVTAMLGTAIWLPAAAWLIAASGLPIAERLTLGPTHWLITWAVASLLGAFIQWRGLIAKKKKVKTVVVAAP